jgi:uncharacterized protein YjbJ (UPF0337 family)
MIVARGAHGVRRAANGRRRRMTSAKTDELKGRVKEAAGALTGDAKLKRQGRLDQAVAKLKQSSEKLIDKVTEAVK